LAASTARDLQISGLTFFFGENDDLDSPDTPEIDYDATYQKAAEHCVTERFHGYEVRLKEEFPGIVQGVKFERLDSPREYNFRTDEIHAVVEFGWSMLFHRVFTEERDVFAAWLKENYSSRDGFVSFIPTDLEDFKAELANEVGNEKWCRCLTVLFEYLCRDWGTVQPEDMDGIHECIVEL
jgi:hypothetical protein